MNWGTGVLQTSALLLLAFCAGKDDVVRQMRGTERLFQVIYDIAKKNYEIHKVSRNFLEATPRFELGNKGFADLCLTTWLCRRIG